MKVVILAAVCLFALLHSGECKEKKTCETMTCKNGKECRTMPNGKAKCMAPCPELTGCSENCTCGYVPNKKGCNTCECVDPCQGLICPAGKQCEGVLKVGCGEGPCDPMCEPLCACPKLTNCSEICPCGYVTDSNCCDTCECVDPCQGVKCPNFYNCETVVGNACSSSCEFDYYDYYGYGYY